MEPPKPERPSQAWRVHGANNEWKAQWNTRVAWSMGAPPSEESATFEVSFGSRATAYRYELIP